MKQTGRVTGLVRTEAGVNATVGNWQDLDEDEGDTVSMKKPYTQRDNSNEPTIYVTRRETVAIIAPSPNADHTMVEAGFLAAGKYLDEKASKGLGDHPPVEVEFTYRGILFTATAGNAEVPNV